MPGFDPHDDTSADHEQSEKKQLAQLYAYLAREGEATVQDVIDDLELAQGTAYSYVNRLVDAGVVDITDDEQPRRYAARGIDLTVTTAVGRRETDADIDTYIDRHGVARDHGEGTYGYDHSYCLVFEQEGESAASSDNS